MSHRETDDDYDHVLFNLDYKHRVILCRDGVQWILQRRRYGGQKDLDEGHWDGEGYYRTQDGLTRLIYARWHLPGGLQTLDKLPEVLKDEAALMKILNACRKTSRTAVIETFVRQCGPLSEEGNAKVQELLKTPSVSDRRKSDASSG